MSASTQRTSAAPTSLLSHPIDGSSPNCLAQAVRVARDGMDEIVFLSAPPHAEPVGHVVLRDRVIGTVCEPGGPVDRAGRRPSKPISKQAVGVSDHAAGCAFARAASAVSAKALDRGGPIGRAARGNSCLRWARRNPIKEDYGQDQPDTEKNRSHHRGKPRLVPQHRRKPGPQGSRQRD
jgi:hypothetical protein